MRTAEPQPANGHSGETSGAPYLPALDGVRGIAIAAVLVAHSAKPLFGRAATAGTLGVDLFFVLSGYLITGILLRTADRPGYFRNFYARRFLRLFPVYYGWLLVLALLLPALHTVLQTSMPDYAGPWWWYLSYFSNWKDNAGNGDPDLGHFWSLAVEEQFYLIWPAVVLAGRRRLPLICGAVIVGALILRCAWWSEETAVYTYRNTLCRVDEMAIGALAALRARWLMPVGAVASVALLVDPTHSFSWFARTIGQTCAALTFGAFVLWAADRREGVLCAKPLRMLGRYSYAIYVMHISVFRHVSWIAASTGIPAVMAVPVMNAAVIVLAALSWRFYEAPILGLKRHFGEARYAPESAEQDGSAARPLVRSTTASQSNAG